MNLLALSLSYIRHRKLNTFLHTLLLSFGVGMILYLLLVMHQLEKAMTANAKGINLVVGAKGSPLQLILNAIYHIDNPTGNISLKEANQIAANKRMVKKSIPLALGDNYQSFRIVGTTRDYPQHYQAQLAKGDWWKGNFEVTIGSQVARQLRLEVGSTFFGSHGLAANDDHAHEEHAYKVTGILQPSGSVIDRLILTNIESVWEMHEAHGPEPAPAAHTENQAAPEHEHEGEAQPGESGPHAEEHTPQNGHEHGAQASAGTAQTTETDEQITALLIEYATPMAALTMPRLINSQTALQAAAPAAEIVRLFSLIGVGAEVVTYFAYSLILIAGLSIFIALYSAMKERRYDLAIMRTLGASKTWLFTHILLEGLLLAFLGAAVGFLLGHGAVALTGQALDAASQVSLTGWIWLPVEGVILLLVMLVGLIAALLPAWQTYRIDISQTLAQ
jgi:putative ABC transport system permease protein